MRRSAPLATLTVDAELLPLLREVLAKGGHLALLARGDSMRPALRHGDRLVIGPLEGEVRPGEVVLWSHRGRVVIHRVVAKAGQELKTRGDACRCDDGWVPQGAVVGRVVRTERQPRWLVRAIVRRIAPSARRLLGVLRWR